MSHPLDSARSKVDRANKHIADLQEFAMRHPIFGYYNFVTEDEPDGVNRCIKLRSVGRPYPVDAMTPIIGDAAHNLRCALDHLACALAKRHDPSIDFDRYRIEFPIKDSKHSFDRAVASGQIVKLGSDGIRFVTSLEPYNGPSGGAGTPLLWAIHRLDIRDKHRALLTTGIYSKSSASSTYPTPPVSSSGPGWGILEEDVVVARWRIGEPQPYYTNAIQIAFNEPEIPEKQPLIAVLVNARALVSFILDEATRQISW